MGVSWPFTPFFHFMNGSPCLAFVHRALLSDCVVMTPSETREKLAGMNPAISLFDVHHMVDVH